MRCGIGEGSRSRRSRFGFTIDAAAEAVKQGKAARGFAHDPPQSRYNPHHPETQPEGERIRGHVTLTAHRRAGMIPRGLILTHGLPFGLCRLPGLRRAELSRLP